MTNDHLDFETRSEVDLKEVGAWKYALHPSTTVMCLTIGDHKDRLVTLNGLELGFDWNWDKVTSMLSDDLIDRIQTGHIVAHNAPFEYAVYNAILVRRFGWPARWEPKLWSCTLARAAMVGLPLDLDSLGKALKLPLLKDLEGRGVMQKLCKPLAKRDPITGAPRFDEDPAKYARLCEYNRGDVLTEMLADEQLPELPPHERAIWESDLIINRRGVAVDLAVAGRAAEVADVLTTNLNDRLRELTGGEIDKATQVAKMKHYLALKGVFVEALDQASLTDLLAKPELPADVREVLTIRRQVGKSSTAKYTKTIATACTDGRVRGVLQYHAAHTGRWGGRLIQPQNYPKGFDTPAEQARAIDAIMRGPDHLSLFYGNRAMNALSDALRGTIVAGPGKVLVGGDFNAIEARTLFWEAGEESALECYRRGDSPYLEMANYIYKRDDITKKGAPREYDIGKRTVLGCGFQMGWPRFQESVYVETAKTGNPVLVPDELAQRAVKAYREKYPKVVELWYAVERAAVNAVKNPGQAFYCAGGKVMWGMSRDRRFLCARLPSGRWLWYYKPEIRMVWVTFCKDEACEHVKTDDVMKCPHRRQKEALCYWGEDPYTHQWALLKTYGGSLVENLTQAIARDLMAAAMQRVGPHGFDVVLTVHDELLCEAAPREGLVDQLEKIMCESPAWAAGLPVKAEGWVGPRYRK